VYGREITLNIIANLNENNRIFVQKSHKILL